ncbi:glycosyltransferase family 2 protein [candidate division WWE3 bacterium]|uniref:Glycosyltransferase family 2 protein n=1 Tax=candidate division WWE3 bacterium TaxID=2053526 RepID=A0A955RQS3_UNCKA|nr:glycosyltransferase family 2 protein [candidate division WWE3 bacterium]
MRETLKNETKSKATQLLAYVKDALNVFYPLRRVFSHSQDERGPRVVALIGTYKTKKETISLVNQLLSHNKEIEVLIVDDSTPKEDMSYMNKIKLMAKTKKRLNTIRTPQNNLKAGAQNFGLEHLKKQKERPDVVVTMDDDAVIFEDTISELIKALYANERLGAVCSSVMVENKDHNLLTRLQALEYHGFNIARAMDEGFFKGPLVMHGMLSAYRMDALNEVEGFQENHLIEDYDITARLKQKGWIVGFAPKALASTDVPPSLSILWKQRVRWYLGGLFVVKDNIRKPINVIQDFFGHFTLISSYLLIALSYLLGRYTQINDTLVTFLIVLALLNFVVPTIFGIITLYYYRQRDIIDVLIRLLIIPEFVYANILSLVLLGSYFYFVFLGVNRYLQRNKIGSTIAQHIDRVFHSMGFSQTWGTR